MCIFVVIEVLWHSVKIWRAPIDTNIANADNMHDPELAILRDSSSTLDVSLLDNYPDKKYYGYSVYFAWTIFIVYLLGAVIFLIAGRKQKGNAAATLEFEVEDRPVNLGR